MAVPTLSTLTLIDDADSGASWSGWGQNSAKWSDEADIFLEGAGSQGIQPFQTGDGGWGMDTVGGIDLSANLVMIWVYTTPGFLDSFANYGCYVRITTGASWTTEFSDFRVGGNDVAWNGAGWHLIVLDANRTRDRGAGTTTLTNINRIGIGFNHLATASKSTVSAIDVMYYGTSLEVTGISSSSANHSFTTGTNTIARGAGSFTTDGFQAGDLIEITGTASNDGYFTLATVGTTTMTTVESITTESSVASNIYGFVTLEDILIEDTITNGTFYGVVTRDITGSLVVNYPLVIGDASGSVDTAFVSRGDLVFLADQPLDDATTGQSYMIAAEDTGETRILFGNSTGTGDNRVGFGGSVIKGQGTAFNDGGGTSSGDKTFRNLDFSAEITSLGIFGSIFIDCDAGVDFASTATDHFVTNTTFQQCSQIDLGGTESRSIVFTGYEGTNGALLWNSSIDIKNSNFLANTNSSGDAPAIEHTTAGSFSYDNLIFAGNDIDVNNSITATNTDSYSETNQDATTALNNTVTGVGQSITGDGGTLTNVELYLSKSNTPTGNANVVLYAHSGSFGTSSVPTGAALATSNDFDVSTLTGSLALVKIDFDDSEQVTLTNTVNYVLALEYSNGDATNTVNVGTDTSSPSHGGNFSTFNGSWSAVSGTDMIFRARTGGGVAINATNGADPGTTEETGTVPGTTSINNTVTIAITVNNEQGGAVQGARVRVATDPGGVEITSGETNSSGLFTDQYDFLGNQNITFRVRLRGYIPFNGSGQIDSDGFTQTVRFIRDTIVS